MSLISYLNFLTLIFLYLVHPTTLSSGYLNYTEFFTSVGTNDAYLNTFYFWWVNVSYLSPFLFFFLYSAYALVGLPSTVVGFLLLAWSDFWFVELADFLGANCQLVSVTTLHSGVNNLLLNSLNKYHPFIFYSSFALYTAAFLFILPSSPVGGRFSGLTAVRRVRRFLLWVLLLNMFSLLLGSWWAMQEGTWGGWWNWDSSETFGLLPSLLVLLVVHSNPSLVTLYSSVVVGFSAFFVVIIVYFVLQINFDLISHNFGARFFHFFNSNLLFIWGLLVLVPLVWYLLGGSKYPHVALFGERHGPYFSSTYAPLAVHIFLYSWLVYSFFDFIELSDLTFLRLCSSVGRVSFYDLNTALSLVLVVYFSYDFFVERVRLRQLSHHLTPELMLCGTLGLGSALGTRLLFHNVLLLFTFITLLTESLTLSFWSPQPQTSWVVLSSSVPTANFSLWSCDGWGVEVATLATVIEGTSVTSWTRWDLTNYSPTDLFHLTTSSSLSVGELDLSGSYVRGLVAIEVPWSPLLLVLAFTLLYLYGRSLGAARS